MRKVKQLTAGLLTAGMVLTGAPFGNFVARAATLEPNTALQTASDTVGVDSGYTYGSSDTTAYSFGKSSANYGSDDLGYRTNESSFNLTGVVKEVSPTDSKKGYDLTLITGYGSSWWQSYYAFGKPS